MTLLGQVLPAEAARTKEPVEEGHEGRCRHQRPHRRIILPAKAGEIKGNDGDQHGPQYPRYVMIRRRTRIAYHEKAE